MRRFLALCLALGFGSIALASPANATERFPRGSQVGLSLGPPAGLNLEYSYELGSNALFLTGGYWGSENYGVQGGFSLERGGTPRKHFSLNLVGGHFFYRDDRDRETEWTYGGVEPYFRYRAFFIAPVISMGNGTFQNKSTTVLITGRLGFTWRI